MKVLLPLVAIVHCASAAHQSGQPSWATADRPLDEEPELTAAEINALSGIEKARYLHEREAARRAHHLGLGPAKRELEAQEMTRNRHQMLAKDAIAKELRRQAALTPAMRAAELQRRQAAINRDTPDNDDTELFIVALKDPENPVKFTIPRNVAKLSKVLKNTIEGDNTAGTEEDNPIELPKISGDTLRLIIAYLTHRETFERDYHTTYDRPFCCPTEGCSQEFGNRNHQLCHRAMANGNAVAGTGCGNHVTPVPKTPASIQKPIRSTNMEDLCEDRYNALFINGNREELIQLTAKELANLRREELAKENRPPVPVEERGLEESESDEKVEEKRQYKEPEKGKPATTASKINPADFLEEARAKVECPPAEDKKVIFEVILGANYLDIKSLLHLGCAKIATLIKGQSPEQIKAILGDGEQRRRLAEAFGNL